MYENTHEWWKRTVIDFIENRENGTDFDGLWIVNIKFESKSII
jgi:hypothetical protein